MGGYASVREQTGFGPPNDTVRHGAEAVKKLLALCDDPDPRVRRVAVKNLCPCHIRADIPAVWERLLVLSADPDAGVRADVVHTLTDGSPRSLAREVAAALERLRNDPNRKVRRQVNRVLGQQARTGRINVL
jgi:HEAT repeat protein